MERGDGPGLRGMPQISRVAAEAPCWASETSFAFPLASGSVPLGAEFGGLQQGCPFLLVKTVKTTLAGDWQNEKIYLRCGRNLFTAPETETTTVSRGSMFLLCASVLPVISVCARKPRELQLYVGLVKEVLD